MGASLNLAPFSVSMEDANRIFKDWVKDTWFGAEAAVTAWKPYFLPFYVYDSVTSTISG